MARILHIEDDSANRLLVRKILTPAGFEVVDAVDGVDGILQRALELTTRIGFERLSSGSRLRSRAARRRG